MICQGRIWTMVWMSLGMILLASCASRRISDTAMGHVVVNAPPQKVFDYMAKAKTETGGNAVWEWCAQWEFPVKDIQGDWNGQTWSYSFKVGDQKYAGRGTSIEGTAAEKLFKAVYKVSGELDGTWTWLVVPDPAGSKIVWIMEYSLDQPEGGKTSKTAVSAEIQKGIDDGLKMIKEKTEKKP